MSKRTVVLSIVLCLVLPSWALGRNLLDTQGGPLELKAPAGSLTAPAGKAHPVSAAAAPSLPFEWAAMKADDCQSSCKAIKYVAVTSGKNGQALCGFRYGSGEYYGVWVQSAKQCHFNMGGQAYYTTNPGLYCGCARSTSALTWEPDSKCADKGPRAPADPPVCRFSKFMNTSAWTLGYWKEGKCHASGLGFGILGSHCTATIGLGGDFNTQLLCRKADPGTPSGSGVKPPDHGCRQTTTVVELRTTPCLKKSAFAALKANVFLRFTGQRPASNCSDGLPWIEVQFLGKTLYMPAAIVGGSNTIQYCPLMLAAPSPYPKSGNAFIDGLAPGATAVMRTSNVPASVTLAQAILESNWGKSEAAQSAKNLFNTRGTGPCGSYKVYRKYCLMQQSMQEHAWRFLVMPEFQGAMAQCKNSLAFAKQVAEAGYSWGADRKVYYNNLTAIMNKYGLRRFDLSFAD